MSASSDQRSVWPWHDAERWERLRRGEGCPLCGTGLTDVVAELPTSWVRVPAAASVRGYACVIHRTHVVEWHELDPTAAAAFLADVNRVSRAVAAATDAAKINLLSLGNLVPHLHVHVCPRRRGDRWEGRVLDPGSAAEVLEPEEHAAYVATLRAALAAR
mgnify:CR=1 FL=1